MGQRRPPAAGRPRGRPAPGPRAQLAAACRHPQCGRAARGPRPARAARRPVDDPAYMGRTISTRIATFLMVLLVTIICATSALPDVGPTLAKVIQAHL